MKYVSILLSPKQNCIGTVPRSYSTKIPTRGQQPYRLASYRAMKMASDLKPATSMTLKFVCILLLKAIFMASEALVASK